MRGLWLAVVLAVASAAPQERDSDDYVTENTASTSSLGEEVKALSHSFGLEVTDILNETKYEDLTTAQEVAVSASDEQHNPENEQTTKGTNFDKTEIVNVDVTNQSIGKNPSEELYLPDEDPIDNTIDDTLGSDDILDVINNFIAEKDPMLQLFLSICFIHPTCYQLDSSTTIPSPHSMSSLSPLSQELAKHLSARRTETARTMLVDAVRKVQKKTKALMFKYIQEGVGARGVSVLATKTIIDSIKVQDAKVS